VATLELLLQTLVESSGATLGAVVDEGNGLWCIVRSPRCTHVAKYREDLVADAFYRHEIAPRAGEMRRGAHLSIQQLEGAHPYIGESFASLYVLVLWFESSFSPELVRARMRRAIPAIESIIVSMPPRGPGPSTKAAKARA
jgi:hypothetical protein